MAAMSAAAKRTFFEIEKWTKHYGFAPKGLQADIDANDPTRAFNNAVSGLRSSRAESKQQRDRLNAWQDQQSLVRNAFGMMAAMPFQGARPAYESQMMGAFAQMNFGGFGTMGGAYQGVSNKWENARERERNRNKLMRTDDLAGGLGAFGIGAGAIPALAMTGLGFGIGGAMSQLQPEQGFRAHIGDALSTFNRIQTSAASIGASDPAAKTAENTAKAAQTLEKLLGLAEKNKGSVAVMGN
jgi:hypothetical protein